MIQKDGVDVEMLPDDWKRIGHVIQTCDFPLESLFLLKSTNKWDGLFKNGKLKQINMLNYGKYGYSFDTLD